MPKPIPGKPYTIIKGDTLTGIALQSYGIAKKWRDIYKANQSVLRSGDPNLIYPGEIINVPLDAKIEKVKADLKPGLTGKDKNEATIVIDGKEVPTASGRVIRTVDTMADGFSASLAFDTTDNDQVELFKPFGYKSVEVYLGGNKKITGRLYRVVPKLVDNQSSIELHGWSKTADIIDSVTKAPYQSNNITLEDRAKELIEPLGFSVEFDSKNDGIFKRVKTDKTTTIFDHLNKLAVQKGILISSTVDGNPLFVDPTTRGTVGTLEEGTASLKSLEANFDGRERWNTYTAYGTGPRKNIKAVSKDSAIPVSRMMAFQANDTTDGDVQGAADYKRNRAIADALTIDLPVEGWYAPDGNLWTENTIVTVISPTLFLPRGFDFLIRQVEFEWTPDTVKATLKVVPPTVYTRGDIDDPWN